VPARARVLDEIESLLEVGAGEREHNRALAIVHPLQVLVCAERVDHTVELRRHGRVGLDSELVEAETRRDGGERLCVRQQPVRQAHHLVEPHGLSA
jgi:hypothetical protein